MNPQNQNNSFRFKRGILALTLGVNLVSISFFFEMNQKAAWAKSETNSYLNINSHQLGGSRTNNNWDSTLIAQDGLIQVPEDRRYINQNFSQRLFWNIPWWGHACGYYSLDDYCGYRRRHLFKDAILITEAASTEYSRATLEFKNPVSLSQALPYARIISRGDMRLNRATSRTAEKIVYDETDPEFNAGSIAELYLTSSKQVSKIVYTATTP
ncbi:hypothetical protein [Allocoleopsis franciscana]|uniref:Uncharacterized protein n=1 Tax=Allocoleopsis franciscana PCC 7113 TaxID=1173027 RepID=K9WS04_9CYAN|nr:hypothetical protein [Allocoleopsis franciscana]AFZ22342.1 hypothetical protein Mic7113_6781 [Allocoleopsis franciscana PCC 7113]